MRLAAPCRLQAALNANQRWTKCSLRSTPHNETFLVIFSVFLFLLVYEVSHIFYRKMLVFFVSLLLLPTSATCTATTTTATFTTTAIPFTNHYYYKYCRYCYYSHYCYFCSTTFHFQSEKWRTNSFYLFVTANCSSFFSVIVSFVKPFTQFVLVRITK